MTMRPYLRFETISLPGAELGSENPLPPLIMPKGMQLDAISFAPNVSDADRQYNGWHRYETCLPYSLQDGYNRQMEARSFRVAILENDWLKAVFLLDWGGRLRSLTYKPADQELLYVNPVIQPANLAVRGAWFSGGVEWNAVICGHSPFTCAPLFAAVLQEDTQTPVLRLYEWDRIMGVPIQMDAYLLVDQPFLFMRIRLVNPHDRMIPMYWWSNRAMPESPDLRVVAPAETAFGNDYTCMQYDYMDMPVVQGRDVSYPTNVPVARDFFFKIPPEQRPWIASVHRQGWASIQCSTARLQGRKMFVWGMSRGGRHWQNWLSHNGPPFMEVQAGLARTQIEFLKMPARAVWEWVEAYGRLEVDGAKAHGADWYTAWAEVELRLQAALPQSFLERELVRTRPLAEQTATEIAHRGSGWGALERIRRMKAGAADFSKSVLFDDLSLGRQQEPWLTLLRDGILPPRPPREEPGSWMVQPEWRRLLEASLEKPAGQNWYAWLHYGVMCFHGGEYDAARQAWERSLALAPSAWAYRNLALCHRRMGDEKLALEFLGLAFELRPDVQPLAVEYCEALLQANRAVEIAAVQKKMPEAARNHGRLHALLAKAELELGNWDAAETLLRTLEMADIREGSEWLNELWLDLWMHRLVSQKGVLSDAGFRRQIQQSYPLPPNLDFRMAEAKL